MKNEVAVTIVLGLFFGGLLAFFVINYNQNKVNNSHPIINKPTEKVNQQNKIEKEDFIGLEIKSPLNDIIVNNPRLKLRGKVAKNSLVVIQTKRGEKVFLNKKNNFEKEIDLVLGENDINITVYNQKIQTGEQSKLLKIYYFNEQ